MVLKNNELINITGGAVKIGVWAAVGGLITFVIGVIDGYLRPLSCNR